MNEEINLEGLNYQEAARYLGYGNQTIDEKTKNLIRECEKKILEAARPRYVYKIYDIIYEKDGILLQNTNFMLPGQSIKNHLQGCNQAILMGVTISEEIDRLLRILQIQDMAKAVISDSLASVAVEQVCDKVEGLIKKEFPTYFLTWRFGVGYGDLPLYIQEQFLKMIDAPRMIGLHAGKSNMLMPTKSVTAIVGLSKEPVLKKNRGCISCNMKNICQYRKKGGHCNV